MSELSVGMSGDGRKHTLAVNDKTYTFALIDQNMKVAYERAIFQRARDAIALFKKDLSATEYMELLREAAATYERGEFALEGKRGQAALGAPNGMLTMVSLLMGIEQQETMQLMLTHHEEIIAMFQKVMIESFPGIQFERESSDPKGQSQESLAQSSLAS